MIVAEQEGQTRRRYRERNDERRLVLPAERRHERKKRQPRSKDDRNRNSAREPCGDPTGIDGNDAGAKEENRNKQKRPKVAAVWRRLQADPLQYPGDEHRFGIEPSDNSRVRDRVAAAYVDDEQHQSRCHGQLEQVQRQCDSGQETLIVDHREVCNRMLRRQQHRPEGENPEQTWDPRFEPVEQWRSSRICVRAKSRIGVEQEPGRIVGGCGPDEKQEHHVERNTPRTLDQLDQKVLGLRHQDEQRDACQEGSERHPNDPKNERKIKNIAPHGARPPT